MFWFKFWRDFRKQNYSRMFVVLVERVSGGQLWREQR